MSCGMKRLYETTNLTFFLAFGDDITGGQPLRNLSKHRPQLTRRSALKQHLREELKISERENQGSIAFPTVIEQSLSNSLKQYMTSNVNPNESGEDWDCVIIRFMSIV